MKAKKLFLSSLMLSIFSAGLHAQTVYYEGFDYDDASSLEDAADWSTTQSGGTIENPTTLSDTGDLSVSGGNLAINGNSDYFTTSTSGISSAGLLADGESLWFSMLVSGDLGGSNHHSGFGFGNEDTKEAFNGVNIDGTGDALGGYIRGQLDAAAWVNGAKEGHSTSGGLSLTNDESQLIVGRFDWGASNDTVTFWLIDNAGLSNLPDEATLTATTSTTQTTSVNVDQTGFTVFSISRKDDATNTYYDEIRFGAEFGDVVIAVPEPGSFALIGGCLALISVMLRRRRS